MSAPTALHLRDILLDHCEDPPPVVTAEYIDASLTVEELDRNYDPYQSLTLPSKPRICIDSAHRYRLRLHYIQLPDSLLVTLVDKHPDAKNTPLSKAFIDRIKPCVLVSWRAQKSRHLML